MIAGRAAVSVDRLIMRADTLRDSTRDLFSVWPPEVGDPQRVMASGTLRCRADPIERSEQ